MNPVKTAESNFVYQGPNPEISDLHCRVENWDTFSVWQFTDVERATIAAGGFVRLGIHGSRPIPPISMAVVPNGGPWARADDACDVCGLPFESPSHNTDGHAYRSRKPK